MRSELFARLSKIQRSISHRAPLQEVLDSITEGARELLGEELVGLRLIDEQDPSQVVLVSECGTPPELLPALRRGPVGEGAGGRSITENRMVILDHYSEQDTALPAFREAKLQTAMAAPVREQGKAVGSLVVGSYEPGRVYTEAEQEVLMAFAEHAGLALNDARAVEAMRAAQRAKDAFLAMVSHELKTPLTVVLGVLKTLKERYTDLDDDLREELVAAAYERGDQLAHLIDQLLQGARGELPAAKQPAFLPDLVTRVTGTFENKATLDVGAVPSIHVTCDPAAVEQALGILLDNAIAHSPEGSTISVEADVDAGRVRVAVCNPGRLPPGDPGRLFLPFERGPDARPGGVGLGLYIASRLAEAMGGALTVHPSDGSVHFTLTFPYDPAGSGT